MNKPLSINNSTRCLTHRALILFFVVMACCGHAQQDPQYTQYMYNTQVVNPAYAGSRETLSFGVLGRYQWAGLEGAPKTGTFTANLPIGTFDNMGVGISIVHDQIGPAVESNAVMDLAYSIHMSRRAINRLSFGIKVGADILDVDYSKLSLHDPTDPIFQNQVDSKLQPQAGAGMYYNTQKFYAGFSVPNFLNTKHFDESSLADENVAGVAVERLHYFFISGYVFDLNHSLKFKPATLVKFVSGSPLQWDISANFMLKEKFVLGAAYRWNASLSGLLGFHISDAVFAGVGYDYQTTDLRVYSSGSYEAFLRFDIFNKSERIVAPRFF